MITQAYLKDVFEYRDGALYWKFDPHQRPQWNGLLAGKRAGRVNDRGYLEVCFRPNERNGLNRTQYVHVHRLVYCLHHGTYPEMVDHINGDVGDNRIENLRAALPFHNSANHAPRPNASTGVANVSKTKYGKFEVRVSFAKKRHFIGHFETLDEAALASKWASKELRGAWRRSA